MSESMPTHLIEKFVAGTLSPDEQATFDRLFESDASFCEKSTQALGERLGEAPGDFLDRVGQQARPPVEDAFRRKFAKLTVKTKPGAGGIPWALIVPLGCLLGALAGLFWAGRYVVHCGRERQEADFQVRSVALESAPAVSSSPARKTDLLTARHVSIHATDASHAVSTDSLGRANGSGSRVRFEGLPASSSLTIEIYDAQGHCTRHFYRGPWTENQKLDWDGRSDDGKVVVPGIYEAVVVDSRHRLTSRFTVQ